MPTNEKARFELLFIGNELLIGKTLNTNSQWLTRVITSLGGICYRMTVVRDELDEISNAVKEILSRAPRFLIISGGLGPTYDDITLEGLSGAVDKPLVINETALAWVTEKYEELQKRGRITNTEMTPSRVKMAQLPLASKPLYNPVGTAPGVLLEQGKTKIICLPGVPQELEAIFEGSVKTEIVQEIGEYVFLESSFLVKGIGESALAPLIDEVRARYFPYIYVKSHPRRDQPGVHVEFHLTTTHDVQCYGKGKEFLEEKIRGVQSELEAGVTKLGGETVHPQDAQANRKSRI